MNAERVRLNVLQNRIALEETLSSENFHLVSSDGAATAITSSIYYRRSIMLLASVTCGRMTGNLPDDFHRLTKEGCCNGTVSSVPPKVVKNLLRPIRRPAARRAIGSSPVPGPVLSSGPQPGHKQVRQPKWARPDFSRLGRQEEPPEGEVSGGFRTNRSCPTISKSWTVGMPGPASNNDGPVARGLLSSRQDNKDGAALAETGRNQRWQPMR